MSTTKSKKVQKYLQDSYNRIMAMQSLHEMLYKSDDFINIDIKYYISILAKNLIKNYQITAFPVNLEINIPEIKLPATIVTPLALMLNEIICNSLKYAFPNKKNGHISINAKLSHNNILFIIKDNGIGFKDKNAALKSNTLGIQLMQTLARQIKGNIEINSNKGVEYIIKFRK